MVKLCSQNIFVWYIQTIENIRRIYKIVGKYYHKKEMIGKCLKTLMIE